MNYCPAAEIIFSWKVGASGANVGIVLSRWKFRLSTFTFPVIHWNFGGADLDSVDGLTDLICYSK
jgi:hypothetical protein